MQLTRVVSLVLATALLARADVLPPVQDSSSLKGKLSAATGKAGTLTVSARSKGYVLFNINSLPADVLADDIAQARLRVYFPTVIKAGDIIVYTVAPSASLWDEVATAPEPAINPGVIATFPAGMVVGKQFLEVDVTEAVRAWRAGTASNFGFALVAAGQTSVTLGAKEGPGSGYPCELEVQIDRVTSDGSIGSGQIADGAVTALKLGPGAAVANLSDGSVSPAKLTSYSLTITAGTGLSGGGVVSLGGSVTVSLGSNLTLGGTTTGAFSGDGSGLTNLNVATNIADRAIPNAKLANAGITITAGAGLEGGGTVALGGGLTVSLGSDLTLAGTTTGSFSGSVLLPAGSATEAPLRVQTGVNLTTPVFGAVEFDGTNLYLTNNSDTPTRRTVAFTDSVISTTQIASGAVGSTKLAADLTLGGTTMGTFSGSFSGNATTATTAVNATNFTGSLAGNVTGPQSATVVATVGGVTAGNVAAGANLANAAASANTASTIVKRDAGGNFSAGSITVGGITDTGNLALSTTNGAGTVGVITQNGTRLIHSFGGTGSQNFFAGAGAGNFTMTGTNNTVVGTQSFKANTTGQINTAYGASVLSGNTTGDRNTADGFAALVANTTGSFNTAMGEYSLASNTIGLRNTAIGSGALFANTTGSGNIAIGKDAGGNLTGDNNIAIGHAGLAGETGVIRIGTAGNQTKAFVAGIRGITTGANDAISVVIDSTGQIGTISSSRRYKEDISDMGDASARLQSLRPVTFHYKQPYANGEKPIQYGLIAEEVAETFPELAVFNAEGQPETVKYQDLTPMLLNEVQKLRAEKDALQTRLEKLEAAFDRLPK